MAKNRVIAYGFTVDEEQLTMALVHHLKDNPGEHGSWEKYTPKQLLEDEDPVAVYQSCSPIGGVSLIRVEDGNDYSIIACSSPLRGEGNLLSTPIPGYRDRERLEEFSDFIGLEMLPEFRVYTGTLAPTS